MVSPVMSMRLGPFLHLLSLEVKSLIRSNTLRNATRMAKAFYYYTDDAWAEVLHAGKANLYLKHMLIPGKSKTPFTMGVMQ